MGSGNAIWVLVTPPMLWSHFTYHIYSIYRISSPRHILSSLMFFATSQLSPLSSTDHMDYGHVSSECVWLRSIHIDEQRQANNYSGPMTTWPATTHSGSIQLGPHKAMRGFRQISAIMRAKPTLFGHAVVTAHSQQTRPGQGPHFSGVRL